MQFFGFFSVLFGILIIAYPDLISILIGSALIFMGMSSLLTSLIFRRPGTSSKTWNVGGYEISRRK